MAQLPKEWGLKERKRSDGRLDIVGTNDAGSEYVARTTDEAGVTERDLEILDIGSPLKRDADRFVGYYRDQRDNARRNWERSLDESYTEGAEEVVHAGLHLSESKVGYSRAYARNWEKVFGN